MDINTFFEQRFWELSKELSTKEIFVSVNNILDSWFVSDIKPSLKILNYTTKKLKFKYKR